ncbi:hypothetical protein [Bacillus alkalicellulosilyticus]|uniref:hypothetical protein n=1 Tax=Alkalihalobacterium alkalicellulosilyticum TaxID=1912214 RepID=UPI0009969248|nr:hypothetical protein [Bacillus alkalicellulosilyticus]
MTMNKYSKLNLIEEEMQYYDGRKKMILEKVLYTLSRTTYVSITPKIKKDLFIRSIAFCKDIERLTDELFDQGKLMNILLSDFVKELSRNKGSLPAYHYLMERTEKSLKIDHYSQSSFQTSTKGRIQKLPLHVEVLREEVLRLEWFLYDLEDSVPGHNLTVELILEILYSDFILSVKREGMEKAVDAIIKIIEN